MFPVRSGIEDLDDTLDRVIREFASLEEKLSDCCGRRKPKTRKALIVEDDDNERELLAGLLRCSGFDVSVAKDGEYAWDYLHNEQHRISFCWI